MSAEHVLAVFLERPWYKFWPSGVPKSIEYPRIALCEALKENARRFHESRAMIYFDSYITYSELDQLVDRFASALQDLGARKGDRIGILLSNIPQFVVTFYGALRAGVVCVPCSPLYKARELEYQLNDAGAETLVCLDTLYPIVQEIKQRTKLRNVITTGPRDSLLPLQRVSGPFKGAKLDKRFGALAFPAFMTESGPAPKPVAIEPDDLALLSYTGGTTGASKGAMITHRNLIVNASQAAAALLLRPGNEVGVCVLPLFHIYGLTVAMNALVLTGNIMLMISDPRDPEGILNAISKHRATFLPGVPTMYVALVGRSDIKRHDLSSVRVFNSGGASLPVQVHKKFEQLTGGRLIEGYGLTEASPVTHQTPLDDPRKDRPGSIGIPAPDTDSRIVDLDTGTKDVKPNEVGELVVKGPQVMQGYWNKPGETKMVLRNGWLYTGDIATMDEDGYFYIVDRKKDMIDVSGFKVWPREVEEVLFEHPAISEAVVIGIPDPYRGETVKAYVTLKPGYEGKLTEEEIIKFCREKIAAYKAPRFVEFRTSLPKSSVGKILRRTLREELESEPKK